MADYNSSYTGAEIDDAVGDAHTHTNKATLDNVTAAFTSAQETKLSGIATGATNTRIVFTAGLSTDQSVADNSIQTVDWTNIITNTLTWTHSSGAITIGDTGVYLIKVCCHFDNNATGYRQILLSVDGTYITSTTDPASSGVTSQEHLTFIIGLNASEVLRVHAYQNSTGALDLRGGGANEFTRIDIVKL